MHIPVQTLINKLSPYPDNAYITSITFDSDNDGNNQIFIQVKFYSEKIKQYTYGSIVLELNDRLTIQ
jgi:hypothetical protein